MGAALGLLLATVACRDRAERRPEVEITVAAASSLQDALVEVIEGFEAANPGIGVVASLAASGTLQRQIEQGAPVDVFLSAGEAEMDALQDRGLVLPETRRVFASNELVLVVPSAAAGAPRDFRDLALPEVRRVALGAPASVPAGAYAEEVLRSLGILDQLRPKSVQAQHVRQVLAYVERGEVDAGVVYRTDAAASGRVRIAAVAPPGSHAPIRYSLAVVTATRRPEAARAFGGYLLGPEAGAILRRHGFGGGS